MAVRSEAVLLSRRHKDPDRAIFDFWLWWPQARPRVEAAIAAGEWPDDLIADMSARVAAIHPKLDWELGKGSTAAHILVISAVGDPQLRASAARWRRASPPADDTFQYASSRQPDPGVLDMSLRLGEHDINLADMRYSFSPDGRRAEIDVVAYHPTFAALPERARLQATFLIPGLRRGASHTPTDALQYTWDSRSDEQRRWLRQTLASHRLHIDEFVTITTQPADP